jgi:hypothetical protein
MAFYLRKAFKVGPLRLNLSKSGLGLSAGVTGARIGLSPRGAYVHGGRHGIYYRKYLKKGKGNPTGSRPVTRSGTPVPVAYQPDEKEVLRHWERSGSQYMLVDTHVTFNNTLSDHSTHPKAPDFYLPDPTKYKNPSKMVLILATLAFFVTLYFGTVTMAVPFFLLGCAAFTYRAMNDRAYAQAEKALTDITIRTEQIQGFPDSAMAMINRLPKRWRNWVSIKLQIVLSELAMRHEDIDMNALFQALDTRLAVSPNTTALIRGSIFSMIVDEMLVDHQLDIKEDQAIRRILTNVELDQHTKSRETSRINHYNTLRDVTNEHLHPIEIDIPLVRGEVAYFDVPMVRLLNERVQNRYQRNRVQYVEVGYEVEMEGRLVITDRRLILIDSGSKEYRVNQILDITTDPEPGIIELTLSGRETPLIITTPNVLVLAAKIQKVVDQATQATS